MTSDWFKVSQVFFKDHYLYLCLVLSLIVLINKLRKSRSLSLRSWWTRSWCQRRSLRQVGRTNCPYLSIQLPPRSMIIYSHTSSQQVIWSPLSYQPGTPWVLWHCSDIYCFLWIYIGMISPSTILFVANFEQLYQLTNSPDSIQL